MEKKKPLTRDKLSEGHSEVSILRIWYQGITLKSLGPKSRPEMETQK